MPKLILSKNSKNNFHKQNLGKKKIQEVLEIFENTPNYPSLQLEKLQPASANLYSIRINRKWRIIMKRNNDTFELRTISNHYQ